MYNTILTLIIFSLLLALFLLILDSSISIKIKGWITFIFSTLGVLSVSEVIVEIIKEIVK